MKRHLGELKWVRFLLSPGAPIWRMRRQSALHKLRRSAKHVAVPIVFWNRKYFAQELLSTFPEPPPPLVGNASPHGISLKRSNIAQTNRNMQKWKHSRYSTTFRILCLSQVGQPSALQCQTFPPGRARRHLSKSVPWSGKSRCPLVSLSTSVRVHQCTSRKLQSLQNHDPPPFLQTREGTKTD